MLNGILPYVFTELFGLIRTLAGEESEESGVIEEFIIRRTVTKRESKNHWTVRFITG